MYHFKPNTNNDVYVYKAEKRRTVNAKVKGAHSKVVIVESLSVVVVCKCSDRLSVALVFSYWISTVHVPEPRNVITGCSKNVL